MAPDEPNEMDENGTPMDTHENADTRAAEGDQSQPVARATGGDSAAPPLEPDEPELPTGTAAGDPTAGVQITPEDAEDAVAGDTGPEHPGVRRTT